MGNQQGLRYSVPIGEKREGESHVYRHHQFTNQLIDSHQGVKTIQEMFLRSVQNFPNNKCLGRQVQKGQNSKHYEYKTYKECHDIALNLGAGMIHMGLIPNPVKYKEWNLKMVGVFSKNREEWMILEFANILYGNTLIPLYDTLGIESFPYILEQTEITTLFISAHSIDALLKVREFKFLKNIVLFDQVDDTKLNAIQDKQLMCFDYHQIIEQGKQHPHPIASVGPNDIHTFSYTSGTTGMPKGVMLKHISFTSIAGAVPHQGFNLYPDDVYLSYLPLPHVLERVIVIALIGYGACISMYGGDVQSLKDDIQLVKPTVFASVPRVYRRLYTAIKDSIDKLTGMQSIIAQRAIETKLYYLKNGGHITHRLWDNLVFKKTKAAFGGRVRLMVSGSAPMSPEVMDFLKIAGCCHFIEGYGQTEGTGAEFCSHSLDPLSGHVGGPLPNNEFKLVDVPEMKYFSTDKDDLGRPMPRGEICIRGHGVFAEYYKEPQKTADTLDQEGWMHSGDIGVIYPNGSLKIIDRVKNIFKLSQGEYIAPEKVEEVYLKVKGITEVFVYGDSTKSFCVAFAVPDKNYTLEVAKGLGVTGEFTEVLRNPQVVKHFLDALTAKGKEYKLNGMENVKKLYLEAQSFQVLELVSNTLKLMRHKAKQHFTQQIDEMYQGQE